MSRTGARARFMLGVARSASVNRRFNDDLTLPLFPLTLILEADGTLASGAPRRGGEVKINDYADALGLTVRIMRHPLRGEWQADFVGTETKDHPESHILASEFGRGASPAAALSDYARRISGKVLVIDAMSPRRMEHCVPDLRGDAS